MLTGWLGGTVAPSDHTVFPLHKPTRIKIHCNEFKATLPH